eukprot:1194318-Prorocentrum_minimum.AAC.2
MVPPTSASSTAGGAGAACKGAQTLPKVAPTSAAGTQLRAASKGRGGQVCETRRIEPTAASSEEDERAVRPPDPRCALTPTLSTSPITSRQQVAPRASAASEGVREDRWT